MADAAGVIEMEENERVRRAAEEAWVAGRWVVCAWVTSGGLWPECVGRELRVKVEAGVSVVKAL